MQEPLDHKVTSRKTMHRVIYLYPPNSGSSYCIFLADYEGESGTQLKDSYWWQGQEFIVTAGPFLSDCHGENNCTDLYVWYAVKAGEKPYTQEDPQLTTWQRFQVFIAWGAWALVGGILFGTFGLLCVFIYKLFSHVLLSSN